MNEVYPRPLIYDPSLPVTDINVLNQSSIAPTPYGMEMIGLQKYAAMLYHVVCEDKSATIETKEGLKAFSPQIKMRFNVQNKCPLPGDYVTPDPDRCAPQAPPGLPGVPQPPKPEPGPVPCPPLTCIEGPNADPKFATADIQCVVCQNNSGVISCLSPEGQGVGACGKCDDQGNIVPGEGNCENCMMCNDLGECVDPSNPADVEGQLCSECGKCNANAQCIEPHPDRVGDQCYRHRVSYKGEYCYTLCSATGCDDAKEPGKECYDTTDSCTRKEQVWACDNDGGYSLCSVNHTKEFNNICCEGYPCEPGVTECCEDACGACQGSST
jgi:hypothetical protein